MFHYLFLVLMLVSLASGGMKTGKLPDDLAQKTISLNPEFAIFGNEGIKDGEKLPLLIYLHGAGGEGTDLSRIANGPRQFLRTIERMGLRCLCVAPQASRSPGKFGAKGGWVPEDLNILLSHLKKSLPIDEKRIYLTGNSMGGYGTMAWAGKYPHHFAAIAPMVGGLGPGGPKDITKDLKSWGENLAKIPMKAYYGELDKVVPPDRGTMILEAIKKAGGKKAEVIILPGEGHAAGRAAFEKLDFARWMFAQKK